MQRKIPLGLMLGAALVVAVGAAGAIWAIGSGSETVGDTAWLVPADVALYATVNTDPASRQWLQMSQILRRLGVKDQAQDGRDAGLSTANLAWDSDIAPYLGGEATIALRSLSEGEPAALAIISTRDGEKAWAHAIEALDERAMDSGVRPAAHTYRGTTIRIYEGTALGMSLWIARKDRYLLIGNNPADAETTLDLAAGKGSPLSGLPRFRGARSAVTDDSLFFLYVNPAALGEAASALAPSLVPGVPLGAVDTGGWDQVAVAFAMSAERTGLRFEWQTVGLDPSTNPVALKSAPSESRFAKRAPADTLVFASGADLYGSYIRGVLASVDRAGADARRERDELIAEVKRRTGLDLERDLLQQFDGEYAVAFGTDERTMSSPWVLAMSTVKDGPALARSLTKIADDQRRDGYRVTTSQAGNTTITEFSGNDVPGDALAYAVTGDDLFAGSSVAAVRTALSGGGLDQSREYREALGVLPSGRSITVFVNIARAFALAGNAPGLGSVNGDVLRFFALAVTQGKDRVGGGWRFSG